MISYSPKRIAKNTIILFVRMLLVMIISLFTTRIILLSLGIDDYGIFSVVGGVVSLFAFITIPLISSTQRFLNYEIGQNNYKKVIDVFNASLIIFSILTILLFILFETIGYYFIIHYLVVPTGRLAAAIWVYHFTIASFCLYILSTPFQALLAAYEDMASIAIVEMGQGIAKLGIAYLIIYTSYDKLESYAVLLFCISFMSLLSYFIFYRIKHSNIRLARVNDKTLYKELSFFAGWNLFESTSGILQAFGTTILLNLFYGTIINAAYGVARQVNSAVSAFSINYMRAATPQITQSYSSNDREYSIKLVFYSSKISYFSFWVIVIPFLIEMDWVLSIWLKVVPEYSSIFCRLMIIETLLNSISFPLSTFIFASGKIKIYQIVTGGLTLLNLPLSLFILKMGYYPYSVMTISIIISILCLISRLKILNIVMQFPIRSFYNNVLLKITKITVLSLIFPMLIFYYLDKGWPRFIIVCIISIITSICAIYLLGITETERQFFKNIISVYFKKIKLKRHYCQ